MQHLVRARSARPSRVFLSDPLRIRPHFKFSPHFSRLYQGPPLFTHQALPPAELDIARSRRQRVWLAPPPGRGTERLSLQVGQSQAKLLEEWSLRFGLSHKLAARGTARPLRPRGG
jgi:hypothetical protein